MKLKKSIKFLLFMIIVGTVSYFGYSYYNAILLQEQLEEERRIREEAQRKYEACLIDEFNDEELSSELRESISDLSSYLGRNYNVSVSYKDLITGFDFNYKEDQAFYGASLIKLLGALYIYEKAAEEELNLDEKMTYQSKHRRGHSPGLNKYSLGSEISLRTLVKYSLGQSDNTAHFMILDYIGFSTLRNYGRDMGAKHTLIGGDNFGSASAADTNIYLDRLHEFIKNNNELGNELKNVMDNEYYNFLILDNEKMTSYHKYGWHDIYFHAIGLVYGKEPYSISILTHHGRGNYEKIIKDIHNEIYKLHNMFNENRTKTCHSKHLEGLE